MSFIAPFLLSGALGSKALSAAMGASAGTKQAGEISKELLGYDFIGLLTKLFVYFTAAFAFAKFMETIIHATIIGDTVVKTIAVLLNIKLPAKEAVPQLLQDLFNGGYHGVKFWDVVKGLAIFAVGFEAYQYYQSNKNLGGQPSAMTLVIFGLIEGGLLAITIPDLMRRFNPSKLQLSASSGAVGSSFTVTVTGLKANTEASYGWKDSAGTVIFSKQVAIGSIFGVTQPFTFDETVLSITAPGAYTIFYDQTAGGGPYYSATFEVLEGISA